MRKFILILVLIFLAILPLVACGTDNDNLKEETDSAVHKDVSDQSDEIMEQESITLPDDFPTDFPFPENSTITEVTDKSNEKRNSYSIRFDFEPDIDLDATFEMYDEYTEKLGYNVILGGEEYFTDGIFQYGANAPMSTDNMFIVTIKIEDGIYGSIDVKIEK